ncbi:GntR family transcriptional regulator [Herbaspirillum frisingense]|uniref:GntR family transcriptional regulator n=1 Tax=Herbaspirillum frisingense TaxID=92645 RepID=UPI000586D15D|nr:GntR family transcriptional regulator [Herbaspirillum frisingense]
MESNTSLEAVEDSPPFIEQVFDVLLFDIAFCKLEPGERIRQSVLASQLKVSRQPISHALQLLKHEGLLQDSGRQGLQVTPIEPEYMRLLFQARRPLEASAAALAAQRVADHRANDDECEFLRRMLVAGQDKVSAHAPAPEIAMAEFQFHVALYRLSGNTVIEQMMNGRWAHIMRALITIHARADILVAWEEHAAIADCVLRGSVLEASELVSRHVQRGGIALCKHLEEVLAQPSHL